LTVETYLLVKTGATPVDDIAHDDGKLKEKATQLCDHDVGLGPEIVGTDLETVDSSDCAILIKIHGGGGAVRVFSDEVVNVRTGPNQRSGYVIVVRKPREDCRFGSPSLRYFHRG